MLSVTVVQYVVILLGLVIGGYNLDIVSINSSVILCLVEFSRSIFKSPQWNVTFWLIFSKYSPQAEHYWLCHNMAAVCVYMLAVIFREELCNTSVSLHPLKPSTFPEFPQLFFILFYIYTRHTLSLPYNIKKIVNKLELISPDSPKFILGDHCSADKSLKRVHQYVISTTRLGKNLDKCYGSVPDAYRLVALPPLGLADHTTILLAPAYIRSLGGRGRWQNTSSSGPMAALQLCRDASNPQIGITLLSPPATSVSKWTCGWHHPHQKTSFPPKQ